MYYGGPSSFQHACVPRPDPDGPNGPHGWDTVRLDFSRTIRVYLRIFMNRQSFEIARSVERGVLVLFTHWTHKSGYFVLNGKRQRLDEWFSIWDTRFGVTGPIS